MGSQRPRIKVDCFITVAERPATPSLKNSKPLGSVQTCIKLLHSSRCLSLKHQDLMKRKSFQRIQGLTELRKALVAKREKSVIAVKSTRKGYKLRLPNAVLDLNRSAELGMLSQGATSSPAMRRRSPGLTQRMHTFL